MAPDIAEMGSTIANTLTNIVGLDQVDSNLAETKKNWCQQQMSTLSSSIKRRVPITRWLPKYSTYDFGKDIMAGISLGLTIIPQSIVFASVVNVPLQFGLYSSIMGNFVYCVFGSVRELNIGPSAVMGLLIADYSSRGGPDYTVLLCFLSGCVELLFAVLNLGFLIDFISAPVSCGFSSAAAVMITATQFRTVLGLKIKADGFVDGVYKTYKNVDQINYWDLTLGGVCMVILLLLRALSSLEWMDPGPYPTKKQRFYRCIVRHICTGRNAIVVIGSSVIAYYFLSEDIISFTADVQQGLPSFTLPPFSTKRGNVTQSFLDMSKDLGAGIFLVPVLSILQQILVAKVFFGGRSIDTTQELFALGLSNILGSCVSALPTTANLPRSALNANNGVRSPLSGIFVGGIVLLALQFLTPYFEHIPQSALASVVICAVIFMLKYDLVPHLWRTNKIDLLVMLTTFFGCIALGAEYGVLVGIALSLAVLLYSTARPNIFVEISYKPAFVVVQPDRMLRFPAVEHVRYKVCKIADERKKFPIVFDGSHLCGMDFTIAQCVKELMEAFQNRQQLLIFTNLQKSVTQMIKKLNPINFVYYPTRADAETALAGETVGVNNNVTCNKQQITAICQSVANQHRIDIRTLGSDCCNPSEYTAALLNFTDVVMSIPRVKLVKHSQPQKCDNKY